MDGHFGNAKILNFVEAASQRLWVGILRNKYETFERASAYIGSKAEVIVDDARGIVNGRIERMGAKVIDQFRHHLPVVAE